MKQQRDKEVQGVVVHGQRSVIIEGWWVRGQKEVLQTLRIVMELLFLFTIHYCSSRYSLLSRIVRHNLYIPTVLAHNESGSILQRGVIFDNGMYKA